MAQAEPKTLGEKLQSLNKASLYALLIAAASIPLFFTVQLPNVPTPSAIDFYEQMMTIPEGSTVLVCSDWTNGTRGESGSEFTSLVRIMMRRNLKMALYSVGDPQAPQVARNVIRVLNEERKAKGEPEYRRWDDWVNVGYFPNAEGTCNGMAVSLRDAWSGRKDTPPGGGREDVFKSPVLQSVSSVKDASMLVVCTASKTNTIHIERLYGKVPLMNMVTGVMGPETLVYYSSGQLKGVIAGLKGAYDLETCMEYGVNPLGVPGPKNVIHSSAVSQSIPGFPGEKNLDLATRYYPSLHFALGLMILAVIIGNVGMVLSRKASR